MSDFEQPSASSATDSLQVATRMLNRFRVSRLLMPLGKSSGLGMLVGVAASEVGYQQQRQLEITDQFDLAFRLGVLAGVVLDRRQEIPAELEPLIANASEALQYPVDVRGGLA